MVANVNLDASTTSLLSAYNDAQSKLNSIQSAVSTGYDVNKASDNPLFFVQAQSLRGQANTYGIYITKLTQNKSAIDQLQSTIKSVTDTANKVRDQINGISTAPSGQELQTVANTVKTYLNTIQNLINNSTGTMGL